MFKICIVFKISIRRDGGSPCRKRKKEESPAVSGSFSGFVREEIARTITLNIGGAVLDGTTLTLPPQSFAVLQ